MNARHKRALIRTGLIFAVCAYPLWFFLKQQTANLEAEIDGFGIVPEFTLNFANQAIGMTHYDTHKHLTVVAVLKESCPESCPETQQFLAQFKAWADDELRMKTEKKVSQPNPIRFVIQTATAFEHLPQDWSIVAMESGDPYLVPERKAQAEVPAIVLIDDAGFYRAYAPLSDPQSPAILKRELSRMISEQYLIHYVSEQNLMWEKYRPRR
jgi:hypothetical protein